MSLDIARSIAFSGLAATQAQIAVISANIANADTKGYTNKTANQSSSVTGGVGTGVVVTGISSAVDKLLLKSLIGSNSDLGAADTSNSYLTSLEQLFGNTTSANSPTTGTSLANTLAAFETALSALAGTPNSPSLQSNAISALNAVTAQLQQTSSGIQKLRGNADQDIASSVKGINSDLQQISDLNTQIKQEAAAGQSTADLEDQRNNALQDLSSMMNVSYFTASNGDLQIYTTSGQSLVDSTAHPLSYTPASNVAASTTYTPGSSSSGFSAITVNGIDITSQITSGRVSALVTLRDQTLPATQSQLDELAQQLASSVNAISNQGTSLPPPTSLTGAATVGAATTLGATGTMRVAVADKNGNLVSYQDLNLASYATAGDLATAINSIPGVSASIDASGHLTIAATGSGNGIAINEMDSSVGSAGQGVSDYFGLNDLVTGNSASNIAVRSDILSGAATLPLSTLDASSTLTAGKQVLSPGSSTVINALQSTLTGSTNFAMAGGLGATTGSFTDYAASIVASAAGKATQAQATFNAKQSAQSTYANSLTSQSGVNVDEETNNMSMLQNKYAAASQLIQTINTMFSALLTAVQAAS